MVVYAFNPSIKEAEACGSLSLRPALSTEDRLQRHKEETQGKRSQEEIILYHSVYLKPGKYKVIYINRIRPVRGKSGVLVNSFIAIIPTSPSSST